MYVKALKQISIEKSDYLPYLTNVPVFITENKLYNIYGKFLICGNIYYLICNDMYSTENKSGLMLYNSKLFTPPYGYESQCWTKNTLREDRYYMNQDEYDNNLCFPEYFYIPNFLVRFHLEELLCVNIFNFYKNKIDTENRWI